MKNIKYITASLLLSGMLSAQNINLDVMPVPGPTPAINITKPKTFKLKNGLTVLVVENNKLPRVNVSLNIDRPPLHEGDIVGVGSIMASQLGKGTTKLSKEEFNKKVDFYGARISFYSTGAGANTLSKYFTEVIELMADAISSPVFSAEEIQKSKERSLETLKIEEKNAESVASKVFNALTYGKNTALGEFETPQSIQKIQLKDVQDFYQKYYTPNNAYLVIVGDVKYNEVKKLVEKSFKDWKKSNAKIEKITPSKNLSTTEINIVDIPTAVQSVINIGNISTLQMKDPQYFAGVIANYILGGGGEARLFMNLREKNGFTYGAYSSLSTSKYAPIFTANANVRNEVTDKAVQEFMTELKGITSIKPEELKNAKEKLKGNFIMSLEKPETIARFALNEKLYDLPANFYTNYLKSIDKVSTSDVSNVAKANILPQQSRIFIAGKASDIVDKVEKLGYPVKFFDKEANPISKPQTKKVDANISAASIGQKYIDAIGGKAKVEKINSLKMTANSSIQGTPVELITIYAKGGKTITEMKAAGATMQKTVWNGKEGYLNIMGQQTPIPEEMKTRLAQNKEVFPEVNYTTDKTFEVKGVETIKGEEAYVIKNPTTTRYYSTKTGLKIAENIITKTQGKEDVITQYYSNYKEVNGVKLPFTLTTESNGMEIAFEVKSYELNKVQDSEFK